MARLPVTIKQIKQPERIRRLIIIHILPEMELCRIHVK